MSEKIKCQVCGELVEDKDLFRSKLNEKEIICGHKDCIEKRLEEKGLNESTTAKATKTSILFE